MRKIFTSCAACILGLVCMLNLSAQNGADILVGAGPCNPIIPLLCASGVNHPENAVDADLSTYATMKTEIGILSSSYLKVGFSNPAPQGSIVAFFVESDIVLNIDLLNTISMRLYNGADVMIAEKEIFTLADVEIDNNGRGLLKLRVPKGTSASSARIDVGGLLALANNVDVYGAVHAPSVPSTTADYIYDGGPCQPVTFGCNSGVLNANHAIDPDKNNYAGLVIPLGIIDNAFLDLGFSTPGPSGSTVTFTLGTDGTLLGLDLLSRLRLTVFDTDGNVIRNKKGFTLAEVELIGSYQFKLKIKTPSTPGLEIARARVTMSSLVGVLSEVLIYNITYTPKIDFASYFRQSNVQIENNIALYPNPAADVLYVSNVLNADNPSTMNIYSVDGKIALQTIETSDNVTAIDISALQNGIYILHVQNNSTITSKPFIVQR